MSHLSATNLSSVPACQALCEIFGCSVPLFGLSHSPDVAAAVTEAGGVGVWAAARATPDEIAEHAARLRSRLEEKRFGVNLMFPPSVPEHSDRDALEAAIPLKHRDFIASLREKYNVPDDGVPGTRDRIVRSGDFFREQARAAADSQCDFFSMAVGAPEWAADLMHSKGKRVIALVGSPRHMSQVLKVGADLIVAQGYDAGGHTGTVGTFSLVPRIVELADGLPVIAAGGVATGSHLVAALALGASGVWLGTAWLASVEFSMPPALLSKVLAAGCEDTVITKASSGKPMRQVKTAWSEEWSAHDAPDPLPMPWQDMLVGAFEGSVDRHAIEPLMYTPAGQSVEWVRERKTTSAIMDQIVREAQVALGRVAIRQDS